VVVELVAELVAGEAQRAERRPGGTDDWGPEGGMRIVVSSWAGPGCLSDVPNGWKPGAKCVSVLLCPNVSRRVAPRLSPAVSRGMGP
jgi:hypothetical protein